MMVKDLEAKVQLYRRRVRKVKEAAFKDPIKFVQKMEEIKKKMENKEGGYRPPNLSESEDDDVMEFAGIRWAKDKETLLNLVTKDRQ